jgi:hypothetical protein
MDDFLQGLGNGETPRIAQGCDFDPPPPEWPKEARSWVLGTLFLFRAGRKK